MALYKDRPRSEDGKQSGNGGDGTYTLGVRFFKFDDIESNSPEVTNVSYPMRT